MSIYTRRGDRGTTSLANGERVDKDDLRIEVNGEIDELNARMGLLRAAVDDEAVRTRLKHIQQQLMTMMSVVAGATLTEEQHKETSAMTKSMEEKIDRVMGQRTFEFVLPGDTMANAQTHLARTQVRKVERLLCRLWKKEPVPDVFLMFFNRLSDYLFALAASL